MDSPRPLLQTESLSAGYSPGRPVVANVSLVIYPGEMLLLRGANGIGKSTLLQCLAGVMEPASGSVLVNGHPIGGYSRRELARHLAYLPQQTDSSSLVGATVRDVVSLGRFARKGWLESAGIGLPSGDPAIDAALSAMRLDALADRDATGLSGGESRRMYFAACLAQQAGILLLDEPFNQFDASVRDLVADALRAHLASGGAVVLATHSETPLAGIPCRVVEMTDLAPRTPAPAAIRAPRRRLRAFAGFAAALAAAAFLVWSLRADTLGLSPEQYRNVFRLYRLPRLLTAFFAGGILSVCGLLFQTVFRNPMASPYTLGTASGAAFGVCLAAVAEFLPPPLAAFAGALLSIAVVRVCAGRGGAARLLLSGIACGYLFNAATLLVQYRLSPEKLHAMVHWGFGAIVAARPAPLAMLGVCFALAAASALAGGPLDAILAGDGPAASFGVHVRHVRMAVFLFAALLTSCAVSVCGPIAFVGLVVPHLVRGIAPGRHARMIPAAALYGGLFLAVCDTLPRILFGGLTPPVGVVTALLGAPVLLYLLGRSRQ